MPNTPKHTISTQASTEAPALSPSIKPLVKQPEIAVLYRTAPANPFAAALKTDDLQQFKAIFIKEQPQLSNQQLSTLVSNAAFVGCFQICDWLLKNCSHEIVEADANICETLIGTLKRYPSNSPHKWSCLDTLGLWHGELHPHIPVVDRQVKPEPISQLLAHKGIFPATPVDSKDAKQPPAASPQKTKNKL
jgi:hypothetical protein